MPKDSISVVNNYLFANNNELAVSKLKQLILRDYKVPYYYSLLSIAYDGMGKKAEAYFSNAQWALFSNYKLSKSIENNFFYQFDGNLLGNNYFNKEAVLIVVPVFNAQNTIQESIESLITQSYANVTIVAIDDCSTDNSAKILKKLESIYPNLTVCLSPVNLGTYNAINLGLYLVRNFEFSYFCIHGADDLMHSRKLELQLRQMESKQALGCIAGYSRVDINTKNILKSSNSGHSMAVFKREVFDRLGYYYDSRFGSDSEYWQRFTKCFGRDKLCAVTKPLTDAYFGSDNLTQANHDKSQARLDLVKDYEFLHKEMDKTGRWFFDFSLLEKLSPRSNQIICGLATIPGRKDSLEETVNSILPQVDKLIVYQNNFKDIYSFLESPKIDVISSLDTGIDMGDAGKFYKINSYPNHYYFSIDDDLIYPDDYVEKMLKKLKSYDDSIIVTLHGRILKKNAKSYYKDIEENFRCLDQVVEDRFIHFGGTGVMAFHTSKFNMGFDTCKAPNMADIWVGLLARKEGIPILVVGHEANWLKYSEKFNQDETIYRTYKSKHGIQDRSIQSFDSTQVVEIKKMTLKHNLNNKQDNFKKKKIVFLSCSYKRENVSKMFKNSLLKLQDKFSDNYDFINIMIDSEGTNLDVFSNEINFKYFEYPNLPVSDKWSYGIQKLKNIDFDYVFIIGSDNTIEDSVLEKYSNYIENGVDIIGMTDMYVYSLEKDQLFYWGGYPKKHKRYGETIGLGRCFSKKLIDSMNYDLWDSGLNRGLDGNMTRKIDSMLEKSDQKFTKAKFSIKGLGLACDIKGGFNISQLEDFLPNSKLVEEPLVLENYKKSLFNNYKGAASEA